MVDSGESRNLCKSVQNSVCMISFFGPELDIHVCSLIYKFVAQLYFGVDWYLYSYLVLYCSFIWKNSYLAGTQFYLVLGILILLLLKVQYIKHLDREITRKMFSNLV